MSVCQVLHREIWVQTSDAWYILDTPAHNYKPFLDVVYKPHLLTCIVVSNKKYTFSNNDMQGILESGSDLYVLHYTQRILGRDLVLGDFIHAVCSPTYINECSLNNHQQTEIRDNLRLLRQRPQIIGAVFSCTWLSFRDLTICSAGQNHLRDDSVYY